MGAEDARRQALNVFRIRMLGAKVSKNRITGALLSNPIFSR
jgi:tryptophan synthase beta subunit